MPTAYSGQRLMVVWFPDWPAVAALQEHKLSPEQPALVMYRHKVWACTATARRLGVRRGERRRDAQRKIPHAYVVERDDHRDAQYFERSITALLEASALWEVLRPGVVALSARSVTRFFGAEEKAAEKVIEAVALAGVDCTIGVADGFTAAVCAARRGRIVPVGKSAEFLAGLPLGALVEDAALADRTAREELIGVLNLMGVRTVGDFAALERKDVATRFSLAAVAAHRVASGEPERLLSPEAPAPELRVSGSYEPPLERVDRAAFAGRQLAVELHERLAARGEGCTRIEIAIVTATGQQRSRIWRCAEPLTAEGTAARIRWQLDGWLAQQDGEPVTELALMPQEVISGGAAQTGLWGESGDIDGRIQRVVARLQGVLGGDVVFRPVPSGGRGVGGGEAVLRPVGDEPAPARPVERPWRGTLPGPVPAQQIDEEILVRTRSGEPVEITERGMITSAPASLGYRKSHRRIIAWSGPWLLDQQWWEDPVTSAHREVVARIQIVAEGVPPLLVCYRSGRWRAIGLYD